MGWTVLYIAFGVVALWLLAEVLLQHKARLRWRLVAFAGFLGVVAGVLFSNVLVIGAGAAAFAVGQTYVTLSFRRGFTAGWAINLPRGGAGRSAVPPVSEPKLQVSDLEAVPTAPEEPPAAPQPPLPTYQPEPLPDDDTGGYAAYRDPEPAPEQAPYAAEAPAYSGYDSYGGGYDAYGGDTYGGGAGYGGGYGTPAAGQDTGHDPLTGAGTPDYAATGSYDYGTGAATYATEADGYGAYSDPYTGGQQPYGGYDQGYDPYGQQGYGAEPQDHYAAAQDGYAPSVDGAWVPQQRDGEPPQPYPYQQGYGGYDEQHRY
ncbi:hypothetical protein [Streptomyces sp. XD-27]|uniref:hypothetical protein n=1 Tax=Streptomyces sp. XD-27 TaxID=3062779 RepID=UPI0026F45D95|nr:hypothetical protein [Streptomyces sp. XD-27]WKX69847.1 hypothetical protein Q3Y56_07920 [Streptomyces sp. XD-27]